MSIQDNKVVFDESLKRRRGLVWLLSALEITFTVVLGLVIATTKIFSPSAESAAGVVNDLSYQGRLTDTSGNALGGSGTNYCFRFSIYDASTSGNKVWPSGTPATTTLSVVNGVFNADIGSADTLTYDFYPTSTAYLNVEVYTVTSTCTGGSWETLTPRQQILATGYTIAAENVYSGLLRTDVASGIVQIGTGAGVAAASVKTLGLDVANTAEIVGNTCTTSGTVWYNSNASSTQALICENGKIRAVTGAPIQNLVLPINGALYSSASLASASGGWQYMVPFHIDGQLSATRAAMIFSINGSSSTNTTTRSNQLTISAGIFSRGTGTSTASLYSMATGSNTWSWSWASTTNTTIIANVTGWRRFSIPITANIPPGDYWYGVWVSQAQTSGSSGGVIQAMAIAPFLTSASTGVTYAGNILSSTNSSRQIVAGQGLFSNATTNVFATSMAITDIKGGNLTGQNQLPWILFSSLDMN